MTEAPPTCDVCAMRRRRPARPPQLWLCCAIVMAVACFLTRPAAAQLDLSSPTLPSWFFTDRLDRLDKHLAKKIERAANTDAPDVAVAEGQKNLLLIARGLLVAGRDNGETGHLATLYALTILDGVESFDKITDALPRQVGDALRARDEHAQKRLDELTQAVQSLRAFNAAAVLTTGPTTAATSVPAAPPDVTTPAKLDAYLQRTLGPLTPMAQRLEKSRVRSTWAELESSGSVSAPYLKQQLRKLDGRLKRDTIDPAAAANLQKMVAVLHDAAGYADLRPRAASLARQIERLLDASDRLTQLQWLDQRARVQLNNQVKTAATLLMKPSTRQAAIEHIDRLERLADPAAMLTALSRIESMPIANLRSIFGAILTLQADSKLAPTADALTDWLARLTSILVEHHPPTTPKKNPDTALPLDIRKVLVQLQQQYDALEKQTLEGLPQLAADPTQVTQPKWTEPLGRMALLAQQTQHLRQIPDWAKRMNRINPMAVRGLYKQYLLIAQDLLKPATSEGATGALAEMDRQLALFEHMPGEELLTQNDADMAKLLGNRRAALWQQLLVLRSQWAAAWGAGIDPTPTGKKLLLMRRLMADLVTAAKLPELRDASAKLNRWAAWEADTEVWTPVQDQLVALLRQAQQQSAADQWDELAKTLDRADAAAAALGLVADLSRQLDGEMNKISDGFAGTLSQCVYGPGPRAVGADQRQALAKLCVYLAAASDAKVHHPDDLQSLRDQIGDMAIQLRSQLATHAVQSAAAAPVDAPDGD